MPRDVQVSWGSRRTRNPLDRADGDVTSPLTPTHPAGLKRRKSSHKVNFALEAKRQVTNGADDAAFVMRLHEMSYALRSVDMEQQAPSCMSGMLHALGAMAHAISRWRERVFPMKQVITTVRHHYGHGVAAYFAFCNRLVWLNMAVFCIWLALAIVPWYISYRHTEGLTLDVWHTVRSFIGANGIVEDDTTWFYYSGYHPKMGSIDMGTLYTIALFVTYTAQAVFMVAKIGGKLTAVNYATYDPGLAAAHSLYGYDMSITDPRSVRSMLGGVRNEIDVLEGLTYRQDRQRSMDLEAVEQGFCGSRKCWLITRRATGAMLSLIVLAASTFAMYVTLEASDTLNADFPYTVTLLVSIVMVTSPFLIRKIVDFERWFSPKVLTVHCALRIYLIKMFNLGFIVFSVYRKSRSEPERCVETETGSLLLQLVIIDLAVSVVGFSLFHATRRRVNVYRGKPKVDFLLADSLLELIYAQSLVWLGSTVCPMLPLVGAATHLIRFFVKKSILFYAFARPGHGNLMKSSDDVSFFDLLMMFTLLLCFAPIGYFLQRSDAACGPHVNSTALDSLSFLSEEPGAASDILLFITKPFPLIFIILILATMMFLQWKHKKRADSLNSIRYDLKEQEARAFRALLQQYVKRNIQGRNSGAAAPALPPQPAAPPDAPDAFRRTSFCETPGDGLSTPPLGDGSMRLLDMSDCTASDLPDQRHHHTPQQLRDQVPPPGTIASPVTVENPGFGAALSAIVSSYNSDRQAQR